jgi:cytohesin
MNSRNLQFFTLNFSLLTSVSRTLLVLAMVWAVDADTSAQAGEIHEAVKAGNVAKVKQLLASKPKLVNERDSQSWTPLHWAAKRSSKEIAAVLLAHNANVTAKAGMTEVQPLHMAAQYGSKEVVELLLEHGADVDTLDRCKRTPLHRAALAGKKAVAEFLLAKGADVDGLWGRKDLRIPWTPLHGAVDSGDKEMVELLLAHKATVNAKGYSHGYTPLDWVEHYNPKHAAEIAAVLRAHGGKSVKEMSKP